jgi:Sulfotransferase domain
VARPLDFIVIGAAKSGTTALHHQLRGHPGLYLPPGKEAPYFTKSSIYERGWDAYVAEHFARAPEDALWGKVTPRYLGDLQVPARMHAAMPDARLIALLRDPVDRALSKYRLVARSGREARPFEEVVEEQLRPENLARARTEVVPMGESIVARGEYGRLLDTYLAHYPREQLLVHLTEEFETDPQAVIDSILGFVGLDPGWTPDNLGERYYEGGDALRFPGLAGAARRVGPLRRLWHRLPGARRQSFLLWFHRQFNVKRTPPPEVDEAVRRRLEDFYLDDAVRLEALLERPVPWAHRAAA